MNFNEDKNINFNEDTKTYYFGHLTNENQRFLILETTKSYKKLEKILVHEIVKQLNIDIDGEFNL